MLILPHCMVILILGSDVLTLILIPRSVEYDDLKIAD
jgi:hypothetical protein